MGSPLPYRIDLLDNEIDTIRTFDVDTQRSIYPVNEIRLLPAREFPLDEAGRTSFRGNFREKFEGDPSKKQIYKDIGEKKLITCRKTRCFACTRMSVRSSTNSGATPNHAISCCAVIATIPLLPPQEFIFIQR